MADLTTQLADHRLIELVLHINREAIHHGAEIALLRDLYLHQQHVHQQAAHRKD